MDPTEKHPSTITDDDLKALREADPAAFDDDDTPGDATADTAAAAKAEDGQPAAGDAAAAAGKGEGVAAPAAGGEGGETAAAAEAGDDGAGGQPAGEGGKPDMIPKARFDEVNGKFRDLEREVQQLKAAQAAAAAEPARDFGQEIKAARDEYRTASATLREQYSDGEIDLDEFERKRDELVEARDDKVRELTKAEASAEALAAVNRREAEIRQKSAAEKWEATVSGWKEQHAEFLANRIRRDAVSALMEEYGKDASLSDEDLLAKVEKEAFEAFNWSPAGTGDGAGQPRTQADAHAARNAADSAAAARGSATPALPAGGVGGRGSPDQTIDVATIKPGNFSKLTKAEQEKLLGEGAID